MLLTCKKTLRHLLHPQRSNNHRAKLLHSDGFFLVTLLIGSLIILLHGLASMSLFADVLGFASSITPSEVITLTNDERAKLGLQPLTINQNLSAAALAKGQDMLTDQYWNHVALDGKQPWDFMKEQNYVYIVAGENLARDFSDTKTMMQAWMDSPTHKANIVNGKYTEIGIAVIDGVLQGTETTLVVQMFGNRGDSVASISQEGSSTTKLARVEGVETQHAASVPEAQKNAMPEAGNSAQKERESTLERFVQDGSEENSVLAGALVPIGDLRNSPLFSPLQLSKALILVVIMFILSTLVYDLLVIGHVKTMRIVGKNLAHIMLLSVVGFLVIAFKAGIVG